MCAAENMIMMGRMNAAKFREKARCAVAEAVMLPEQKAAAKLEQACRYEQVAKRYAEFAV